MDGLNVKFSGSVLSKYFNTDTHGSYIPRADLLRSEEVAKRIDRQLSAETGLWRRMTEMYYRTDVEFTDNPLGNSPVLGAGIKLFGPRPMKKVKFRGRLDNLRKPDTGLTARLEKRERKIEQYAKELLALHQGLEPEDKASKDYIMWLIEGDQALTGGGFDNNNVGEVHKSALKFIKKAADPIDYEDSDLSRIIVESALEMRDHLVSQGMVLGSLKPEGATKVRFDQDTDGMIGFPVYASANSPLNKEIATRLLIESGIDVRSFIGSRVVDKHSGVEYEYRVVDAIAHILDNSVYGPDDLSSVVTLLARIQKHGWKYEGENLIPKPGKTRSVYPNSSREGMIEAMIASPFLKELQRLKIDFMPSLQDKPTRVEIIKGLLGKLVRQEYDYLAADSSQYDATVKGAILATVMYYSMRPFYNAAYQEWFDRAIQILVFKHILFDESLCSTHPEEFEEAKKVSTPTKLKTPFIIFSTVDGLISGAKLTHVGGSFYGIATIHLGIPKLLGFKPVIGPQAGDDTLLAVPKSMIKDDVESTYLPIEEAAAKFGLEINKGKQIWHVVQGEVIKVFLQENYHVATDTYGTGSIFRPAAALFTMERDKGLSISEQLMAEIARMNGGSDNPFVESVVGFWLERETFLHVLFREYGVSAFEVLVDSVGDNVEAIAKRIDVGSFSWGIGVNEMRSGNLPILPVLANVSSKLVSKLSLNEVLKTLQVEERGDTDTLLEPDALSDDGDVLDD